MSDYKTEQDWFMYQNEIQQQFLEKQELTEVIERVDRKLRSKIVVVMRMNKALADVSAKDCFERWKAGYLAQRTGAVEVLERAKLLQEVDSSDLGL